MNFIYFFTTRWLLGHFGNQVAYSKVHLFTKNHRRDVFTPDMQDICIMTCRMTAASNELTCYVLDRTTRQRYSFELQGNWSQRKAIILCNGHPVVKTRQRENWLQNDLVVEIAPGMDVAFAVLLCLMLERADRDGQRQRRAMRSSGGP
ncbi:unnamed protein product [Aphanomyces euteiches]